PTGMVAINAGPTYQIGGMSATAAQFGTFGLSDTLEPMSYVVTGVISLEVAGSTSGLSTGQGHFAGSAFADDAHFDAEKCAASNGTDTLYCPSPEEITSTP